MLRTLALAAACLLAPLAARAVDSFVVPSQYANANAPGAGNALPFGVAGGNTRCQQIYLDSDVPDGPFTIHGVAFRPDAAGSAFTRSIASVDVYLSTTELGSTSLNPTFANNVGFDPTLVRSGPLVLETQAVGPLGGPLAFDAEVWFDTPFPYQGGDLLMDVRVNSTEPLNHFLEPAGEPNDSIGRVCSVGAYGGSVSSPTGEADTSGLVTKFLLVPEPSPGAMTLAACAAITLLRARRR